ncbi:MAG: acyltransferase [Bacteroidia bacterium]
MVKKFFDTSVTNNRIFGLDLMRSAAMICVILSHSGYRTIFGMRYGIVAVESFFVVSGFLIGGILLRDFKDEMNWKIVGNFWIKRWFRTLPLYYAVLLLKFILIDPSIGKNIIYYIFFLQSNIYGIDYLPVSWTLVVEEWFYLLIPFFFLIFFRNGITAKKFFMLIGAFVIAANLVRLGWVLYTDRSYGAIVGNFVFRLDSNLIGVGLAGLRLFRKDIFVSWAKPGFATVTAILIVLISVLFGYHSGGCAEPCEQHLWIRTVWFSLISILVAMIIPFFCVSPVFASKPENIRFRWFVTWISLLSYPIYLIHVEIYKVMNPFFHELYKNNELLQFTLNNLVVVIIGLLLYHFVDKPVLNYRAKLLKGKKTGI